MANNDKANKVLRNVAKIQEWDGSNIDDITDALDVIKANGGEYDLQKNPKAIPSEFEDISNVENIYAVDAEGRILYTDMSVGDVQTIRDRRHREEIGLAPMDDLTDFLNGMRNDYQNLLDEETDRIKRRKNVTSAKTQAYTAVLAVLDKVQGAVNGTAQTMEQALTA